MLQTPVVSLSAEALISLGGFILNVYIRVKVENSFYSVLLFTE
jgi:hypothetical protein